jgi:hypothetical protein
MEKVIIDWLLNQDIHLATLFKGFSLDNDFFEEYIKVKKPKRQFWDYLVKYQMANITFDFIKKYRNENGVIHQTFVYFMEFIDNVRDFLNMARNEKKLRSFFSYTSFASSVANTLLTYGKKEEFESFIVEFHKNISWDFIKYLSNSSNNNKIDIKFLEKYKNLSIEEVLSVAEYFDDEIMEKYIGDSEENINMLLIECGDSLNTELVIKYRKNILAFITSCIKEFPFVKGNRRGRLPSFHKLLNLIINELQSNDSDVKDLALREILLYIMYSYSYSNEINQNIAKDTVISVLDLLISENEFIFGSDSKIGRDLLAVTISKGIFDKEILTNNLCPVYEKIGNENLINTRIKSRMFAGLSKEFIEVFNAERFHNKAYEDLFLTCLDRLSYYDGFLDEYLMEKYFNKIDPRDIAQHQRFSEEFYMAHFNKINFDSIDRKLNPWAYYKNRSDSVKLLNKLK